MEKCVRHYTAEQKVDILRRHLIDKTSVAVLCERYSITAALLYRWRRQFFENGAAAFEGTAVNKAESPNRGEVCELTDEEAIASASALAMRFGLTRREGEVLYWLSEGKGNAEIATLIGVRPRTIGKHLEHVFIKLGVESRTAAAGTALRALLRRESAARVTDQKGNGAIPECVRGRRRKVHRARSYLG